MHNDLDILFQEMTNKLYYLYKYGARPAHRHHPDYSGVHRHMSGGAGKHSGRLARLGLHGPVRAELPAELLPQLPDGAASAAAGGRADRARAVPHSVPGRRSGAVTNLPENFGPFVEGFAQNGRKRQKTLTPGGSLCYHSGQ